MELEISTSSASFVHAWARQEERVDEMPPNVGTVPTPAEKAPRIADHLPLVLGIAKALARGLPPTVELDELVNDGVIGLIEATRRYDPTRGVGFSAYAGHRIRGAMLDGLRVRDPLPRRLRRAHKAEQNDPRLRGACRGIHFHGLEDALMIPEDEACGPEARVLEEELRHELHCGLLELLPRDRQVLLLRMERRMTLRAVAAQLQLSITRVAEIQSRGIVRLRRFLAGQPMICRRRRAASSPRVAARPRQEEPTPDLTNDPRTPPLTAGLAPSAGAP